ncbi:MAG: phosphate ABC transporter permease PstA [Oscillospiraceae bacterium]|jgi:phosphate transport system permease protein|nr:phosphate ABC transporter permease PstA [Oscillospiraceae bacterium]
MRAALPPGRRLRNALARLLLWLSAAAACALLLLIAGYIFFRGAPGVSLELLTGRDSVLEGTVGILPSILNTLYVIAASLAIVAPVGVGAAIYLTEYAKNRRLAGAIEFAAETLAGIPSILYAMMGTMVFCTALGLQRTLLAGSLTLAVMTLPTVIRTTQESLKAVPRSYREGALGLGAGQWRAIRTVVLPASLDGIVTGCILAVGRVVGESAVLMYTAGLSTAMQDFSNIQGLMRASGATLTVALYVYAKERSDFAAAFSVATVLLVLTALLNLTAFLIGRRAPRREGGGHG